MAKPVLNDPRFFSEEAAFAYVEAQIWPEGPVCPHCGSMAEKIGRLEGVRSKPSKKHPEGVVQVGLRKCYACRGPAFTVRKGTIFEDSHLPLREWLQAIHLLCASKKGMSTRQIQRMLNCGLKTAWHLTHRIREIMAECGPLPPLGGEGQVIESDETYWGPKDVETHPEMQRRRRGKPGPGGKARIMTLVERGGRARSVHVADLTNETMQGVLLANADTESRLVTDEGTAPSIGLRFARHDTVKHGAKEYAHYLDEDGEKFTVTTNTVEGFFSVFKRGMRGTYQHCKENHLHRYVSEFDFRYNNRAKLGVNDVQRERIAVKAAKGKRLTYQTTHSGTEA